MIRTYLLLGSWVLGLAIANPLGAQTLTTFTQLVQVNQPVGQFPFTCLPSTQTDIRQALNRVVDTQLAQLGYELIDFLTGWLMAGIGEQSAWSGCHERPRLAFQGLEDRVQGGSAAVVANEWRIGGLGVGNRWVDRWVGIRWRWWLRVVGGQHYRQYRVDGPQLGPVLLVLRRARQTAPTYAHAQKHVQSSLASWAAFFVHRGPAELEHVVAVRAVEYRYFDAASEHVGVGVAFVGVAWWHREYGNITVARGGCRLMNPNMAIGGTLSVPYVCRECGSENIRPHGLGSFTRATCNACDAQDFVPRRGVCGGCKVNEPFEHRCFGPECVCRECREADMLFGGRTDA